MNTRLELLEAWRRSVSVMHIAHAIAASRYAKWHRWLSGSVAVLAAGVGTFIFAALLADDVQAGSKAALIGSGLVSMLLAGFAGAATLLNLGDRARHHMEGAAAFQRLRREMDEELVRLAEGKARESYDTFKDQWQNVLHSVPPIPQDIHDRVNRQFEAKHQEGVAGGRKHASGSGE